MKSLVEFAIRNFFSVFFLLVGKPKYDKDVRKTLGLYVKKGEFSELFSEIRMWDAPLIEIERLVPKNGIITDLGCGDGLLVNYLAIKSKSRKLLGIEINKERLREANKGLKNTRFVFGDILKRDFPKSDCIILMHVLHHLPSGQDQERVMTKCFDKLPKGGTLVIVEIAEKPVLKYLFTWLTDAFIVPILFEKRFFSFDFYYRKTREWKDLLEKYDFKVKQRLVHKGKPFSHLLILASK